MLSPELELHDLDARHWRNAWRLLVPPRVLDDPRWALVVIDASPERVVKVIVGGTGAQGSLDPSRAPLPGIGSAALASYARKLGVGSVIVIDRRLIALLSAELESALDLEQDGAAQVLVALRALKPHAGRGLWSEPPLLELLPAPAIEPLQRTFDVLVPDDSALLAYVIEDDRSCVHTSIIAVKQRGDITRAATHRAIADIVSEPTLARDWERSYPRVLAAVHNRFARPAIGLFLERATLLKVLTGPSDQLAREINAKRVVIDPAPAWLLGLLGGAAVAAVAGRAARGLAQMLPQAARDRASAFAQRARGAIDPFAPLGFDPLELWARVKHHYRP
jgi:hypothetical protein